MDGTYHAAAHIQVNNKRLPVTEKIFTFNIYKSFLFWKFLNIPGFQDKAGYFPRSPVYDNICAACFNNGVSVGCLTSK